MIVFRISKSKYSSDLSGLGSKLNGGRWNSKGTPAVYTSSSRSLATLELLAHIPHPYLPTDLILSSIEIPDNSQITEISKNQLPIYWNQFPFPYSLQKIGDNWIKKLDTLILKVPSAIIQDEFNFILNPLHPDTNRIKLVNQEPYKIDERIL